MNGSDQDERRRELTRLIKGLAHRMRMHDLGLLEEEVGP